MRNAELKEHGILTDKSSLRIHVAFGSKEAFTFWTERGRRSVANKQGHLFTASQPWVDGRITGMGRRVHWTNIEGCQRYNIPGHVLEEEGFKQSIDRGSRGTMAERVATRLLKDGIIKLPYEQITVEPVTSREGQLAGYDLIAHIHDPEMQKGDYLTIQVKCDWHGGTKGLALQTHECNPLGIH